MELKLWGKLQWIFVWNATYIFNRLDWLEPCDESVVEVFEKHAASDETPKRKGGEDDEFSMKKQKVWKILSKNVLCLDFIEKLKLRNFNQRLLQNLTMAKSLTNLELLFNDVLLSLDRVNDFMDEKGISSVQVYPKLLYHICRFCSSWSKEEDFFWPLQIGPHKRDKAGLSYERLFDEQVIFREYYLQFF